MAEVFKCDRCKRFDDRERLKNDDTDWVQLDISSVMHANVVGYSRNQKRLHLCPGCFRGGFEAWLQGVAAPGLNCAVAE
jgi:hypothetical protein